MTECFSIYLHNHLHYRYEQLLKDGYKRHTKLYMTIKEECITIYNVGQRFKIIILFNPIMPYAEQSGANFYAKRNFQTEVKFRAALAIELRGDTPKGVA